VEETDLASVEKKACREDRVIVFIDESGLSERPTRVRAWAPRGQIGRLLIIIPDGLKAHRRTWGKNLDSLNGELDVAFLPPYASDMNPVEYLWARLKRHAMAHYCPESFLELTDTAQNKLRGAQKRGSLIAAFWKQAELY